MRGFRAWQACLAPGEMGPYLAPPKTALTQVFSTRSLTGLKSVGEERILQGQRRAVEEGKGKEYRDEMLVTYGRLQVLDVLLKRVNK